jgi:hypothetical protein
MVVAASRVKCTNVYLFVYIYCNFLFIAVSWATVICPPIVVVIDLTVHLRCGMHPFMFNSLVDHCFFSQKRKRIVLPYIKKVKTAVQSPNTTHP